MKLLPRSSSRGAILDEGKEEAGLKEFLEEAKGKFEGKPQPPIQEEFKDSQFGTKLIVGVSWTQKAPKKQEHRSPPRLCSKQLGGLRANLTREGLKALSTNKTCSKSAKDFSLMEKMRFRCRKWPPWGKRPTTANGICAKLDRAASQGEACCNSVGWILNRC